MADGEKDEVVAVLRLQRPPITKAADILDAAAAVAHAGVDGERRRRRKAEAAVAVAAASEGRCRRHGGAVVAECTVWQSKKGSIAMQSIECFPPRGGWPLPCT